MKSILQSITYIVGAGELILAIYFWVTNSKSEIRRVMSLISFFGFAWAISNGLASYTVPSNFVWVNLLISFTAGVVLVSLIFHLSLIFPFKIFNIDKFHKVLIYFPTLIIIFILLFSKTIVESYTIAPNNPGYVISGPLFVLYVGIITLYFIAAILLLIYKIKFADGINKKYLILVVWSFLIGGAPAIYTNAWIAFTNTIINPLIGVDISLIWLIVTTYIITIKNN